MMDGGESGQGTAAGGTLPLIECPICTHQKDAGKPSWVRRDADVWLGAFQEGGWTLSAI